MTEIMNPLQRPYPGERIEWCADNYGGMGTVKKQIRHKDGKPVVEVIDDVTGAHMTLFPYEYTLAPGGEAETRCAYETRQHVEAVRLRLNRFRDKIERRARGHDITKFSEPEFSAYASVGVHLKRLDYGSPEYMEQLKLLGPALEHHYKHNSHHPEHYDRGIRGMDLLDVVEMFCDWWAVTYSHDSGNILRSIDINEKRFEIPPELSDIFRNTVERW